MRGIRLDELVDRLRAEVGHSTNAQVGQNSYDYLVQVLSRTQRRLCEEYDWAHLKIKRDIAAQAGQRYYPCPEDLHYERITDVDFKDGTLWRPLIRGVDESLFSIHDSDRGHQNWPIQNWDVHENLDGPTDTVGFLEFWPIPNRSAAQIDGMVRLTGYMQAPELINPNDKCVLDGSLLVLYAAAEICARQNQSDAQMKLTAAQQLMSRLQNQNSNKKKYVSFSPNADAKRKNPWRQRNIVGVSRGGGGGGGIGEAPADDKCYLRKNYSWVELSACIDCDGDGGSGVIDGTRDNVTLRWDADVGEWVENLAVRSEGDDRLSIYDKERTHAWNLRALRLEDAYDPWLDETKNFNFMVIEPKGPYTSNSAEKYGVSVLADRFTVRSGDESGNPAQQSPAFRVDNEQIDIGLRDYTTNTFMNGDVYVGMSDNFYGADLPFNKDNKPGTLFSGGIAMVGSYINGQTLDPVGNENPEAILNRAFAKDAQLNMVGNRLYGLPAPIRPDDAVNLAYFEANGGGGGNGAADNVANGTELGQLLGWNGVSKYAPVSFAKFLSGPDRLETQALWVNSPPTAPQSAVNKAHLDKYVEEGTVIGNGLFWDDTEKVYKQQPNVQYKDNALQLADRIVLKENRKDGTGYTFMQRQFTSALDPWTGEYINLNSLQIQPHNDVAGSGYESGVAILGDRFTVRVPAFGDDPYNGEIAFRLRQLECVIGVDSYETTTIIQGDTYIGYKRGEQPDNNDQAPGTLFTGGILVGRDKPVGTASIGMEGNIIFGLGDPQYDDHAVNRKWVKNNALTKTTSGDTYTANGNMTITKDLMLNGNSLLGSSNANEHFIQGDTYIGYDPSDRPDNNDAVAGTLFLERGVFIGKDRPVGTASIGMEGNVIFGLGSPQGPDHAVSKQWVESYFTNNPAEVPKDIDVETVDVSSRITVTGTSNLLGSATIGSSYSSTINMIGDAYVGYAGGLPDNNDSVPGTLFCGRGILIGRGLAAGTASIGMENNHIINIRYPQYTNHAPTVDWCSTNFVKKNRFSEMAETAMKRIGKAESLEDIKTAMIEMLKAQSDDVNDKSPPEGMTAMPEGITG